MQQAFNRHKAEVLVFLSDISKDIDALGGYDKSIIVHMRRNDAINVELVNKELENLLSNGKRVVDFLQELLDKDYANALNKAFDKILLKEKFEISDL
jgi:hypothetical protein